MARRPVPPLVGDRVTLRLLGEGDLPLTLAWRNADCNRVWFVHSEPITWEQHLAWFERTRDRDDDLVWVIELRDTGRPVGQVSVYNVEWARRRAECGRLLIGDLAVRGRGLAREAIRLCVGHATVGMGLEEVYCSIVRSNAASRAAFAGAGFHLDTDDGHMVRMVFRTPAARG